jgi:2-polyprenyl-3-methyl-5-hydroxy-6-metoxy-1,4-benzoquinol methylase
MRCKLCQSSELKIISQKDKFKNDVITFICNNCGLVFTPPIINKEKYNEFYKSNDYINFKYQTVEDYFRQKSEKQKERSENIFRFAKNFMRKGCTVLDIGCGFGFFLRLVEKNKNYNNLVGIEPSVAVVKYIQKNFRYSKVEYHNLTFDNYCSGGINKKFDFIVMSHVLEHILYPNDLLIKIKNLLAKDGFLYIEVPNLFKYSGPLSNFIQLPHPFNYSPCTLDLMLKKHGFRAIKLSLSGKTIKAIFIIDDREKGIDFNNYGTYEKTLKMIKLNKYKYKFKIWIKSILKQ